jgi:hypothetical protein
MTAEQYSNEWYLEEYLKYGSVEEVFKANRYQVYLSPASYHRLVNKYGIVKGNGRREVSLSEVLHFFAHKALLPTVGIETLYYDMPPSFQTSLASLHRIYQRVIHSDPQRFATALVLYEPTSKRALFGHEVRTQALQGKFRGNMSLPMTFCGRDEDSSLSILRVLQQEVFSREAIGGKMPVSILTDSPFMKIAILDVEVRVYALEVENEVLDQCNSYKLDNYEILNADELTNVGHVRSGMKEIMQGFTYGVTGNIVQSDLNQKLLSI